MSPPNMASPATAPSATSAPGDEGELPHAHVADARLREPLRRPPPTSCAPTGNPGQLAQAVWVPARQAAGFPTLRFHNLRHSAVPLWIAMGANLPQGGRWLGHGTVQITADVYGHLFPETNDPVINRLDQARRATLPQPADATATIDDPGADTMVRRLRPGT
jgi:integrase